MSDQPIRMRPPEPTDMLHVLDWRNQNPAAYRTPYYLTDGLQSEYYKYITARHTPVRMWSFVRTGGDYSAFAAFGGLQNIEWENRRAEISIVLNPEEQELAPFVDLILGQAFDYLNLHSVWAEIFKCNPLYPQWEKIADPKSSAERAFMPDTKYWKGIYYASLHITFFQERI